MVYNMQDVVKKEALQLMGVLSFIFISVLLSSFIGLKLFLFLPIIVLVVLSFRTNVMLHKVMSVTAYLVTLLAEYLNSAYIGFYSTVVCALLISAVFYMYSGETFLSNDKDDYSDVFKRAIVISVGIFTVCASAVLYGVFSGLFSGTFLEKGFATGVIFGIVVLVARVVQLASEDKQVKVGLEQKLTVEQIRMLKERKKQEAEERAKRNELLIKFMSIWLVIIDFSIFGYVFSKNDQGFGYVMFLITLTVLFVTFFPENGQDSVYNLIYSKLRPFQSVAFLILIVAHENKFDIGMFYLTLIVIAHIAWVLGYINLKTFFVISILIYFVPLIGYKSNPFVLIDERRPNVRSVIMEKRTVEVKDELGKIENNLFSLD